MRAVFVLLILAALAGVSWYWLSAPQDPAVARGNDPVSERIPYQAPSGTVDPAGVRERVEATENQQTSVHGRCVAAEDGTPLADCQVSIYARPKWSPKSWELREVTHWDCRTDVRGVFDCAIAGAESKLVTVRARRAGRVPTLLWDVAVSPASRTELEDTILHRGCKVSGTVRDTDGAPVSRYDFSLSSRQERVAGKSGTDGSFVLPGLLPPGRFQLQGEWPRKILEQSVEIPGDRSAFDLVITIPALAPGRSITGRVVDEAGSPVRHALVQVVEEDGIGGALYREGFRAVTEEDGSFALNDPQATSGAPALLAISADQTPGVSGIRHATSWGRTDLRLTLEGRLARLSSVRFRVIDGDSGARIESFRFRFYAAGTSDYVFGEKPNYARGNRLHNARGEESRPLPGVQPVDHFVAVNPTDRRYAPSGPIRFSVPRGESITKEVKVYRRSDLRVVVRSGGSPVTDAKMELIRSPFRRPFRTVDQAYPVENVYDYAGSQGLVYSVAKTDSDGAATLSGSPGSYVIRLTSSSHPARIEHDVTVVRGGSKQIIELPSGGAIRGKISPPSAWLTYWPGENEPTLDKSRTDPQVFLVTPDRRKLWPLPPSPPIAVDEAGTFAARGVPPGRYRIRIVCQRPSMKHAFITGPEFDVAEGREADVEVTVPEILTATLSGEIHLNGKPMPHTYLSLLTDPPAWRGGYLTRLPIAKLGAPLPAQVVTDDAGRFGPLVLRVGRYSFVDHQGTVSHDHVDLAADEVENKVFRMHRARLRIRLTTPDGAIAGSRPCCIFRASVDGRFANMGRVWKTDAEGTLLLEQAPQFEFFLGFYDTAGSEDPGRARRITHRVGPLRAPLDKADAVLHAIIRPVPKDGRK